ncbi:FAD-dependent oxidoreductase [bacterium]|nr:FAD-dependent oxidoreductase [bacterium]
MEPFSKFQIGDISLPNRLIMAPVKTSFGSKTGDVNHKHLAYYRRRAEGGVGAVITEPLYIDQIGREHPKQLGISSYKHLDGLKSLVSAIHEGGSVAIAHLNHGGSAANPKVTGQTPEAPSEVTCQRIGVKPTAMSVERIQEVVKLYAGAVGRAVEAGFDIIEIQFGLGYLISQFISSSTNQRHDEYGGSWENRLRFGKEILESIDNTPGLRIPIITRISATLTGDGSDLKENIQLAQWLESKGVSAIHVASGSTCDSPPWYFQHMRLPKGKNLEWASIIKKNVTIPVFAAGRMGDPTLIRESLSNEIIDGVALGRPLIADPDLPNKMMSNKDEDVYLCGACLQGCLSKAMSGEGISCLINPEVGHEGELIPKAERTKRMAIIGGGPAGMQAALTLNKRGHHVVLYDDGELGGRFNLAALPPGKGEMSRPLTTMINRVKKTDIKLHLKHRATIEDIIKDKPDHIVLATGSMPIVPDIENMENIFTGDEILNDEKNIGKNVLIIGGGMIGLETAEMLALQQHTVTVVEMLDEVGGDMEMITAKLLMKSLTAQGVKILTGTKIKRFKGRKAYIDGDQEDRLLGEFDTVIAAVGSSPINELEQDIRAKGFDVHLIGDVKNPRNILEAVTDGFKLGCSL